MSNSDRVYRAVQPSDLPRIQAGTLKAFYIHAGSYFPAKLVSTQMISGDKTNQAGWIVEYAGKYDFYTLDTFRIVVDVTPTKRYAIWSHKAQRFVNLDDLVVNKGPYGNKADAEIAMEEMFKKYATSENQQKQFYVVEWEIKDDNV